MRRLYGYQLWYLRPSWRCLVHDDCYKARLLVATIISTVHWWRLLRGPLVGDDYYIARSLAVPNQKLPPGPCGCWPPFRHEWTDALILVRYACLRLCKFSDSSNRSERAWDSASFHTQTTEFYVRAYMTSRVFHYLPSARTPTQTGCL